MRKSFLYILGCTSYCLGELPRALETYYEAADCADTTASDCDLRQLGLCYVESTSNLRRSYTLEALHKNLEALVVRINHRDSEIIIKSE